MTPTPRALAATTAAALALAALAGCSSSRAAGEPVTPDPATVQAQKEAAKAAAYKESEAAIRAYVTDINAEPMKPAAGWYATQPFIEEQKQLFDEIKKQKLTIKISSKLASIEPVDYQGPPMTTAKMEACEIVTGGVYDSKGRNVTVTPEGKPITDKERRISSWYSMYMDASATTWQIEHVEQRGTC